VLLALIAVTVLGVLYRTVGVGKDAFAYSVAALAVSRFGTIGC
jgi:hypothetical protein